MNQNVIEPTKQKVRTGFLIDGTFVSLMFSVCSLSV